MIRLPRSTDEARSLLNQVGPPPVIRAGGTDVQERRRHGMASGALVDLRDLEGLDLIEQTDAGGLRIGARVTVSQLHEDPLVQQAWPGLSRTARGLATPQIRNRATVAGNLLQEVRCWYFRTPAFTCLKKGGAACLARQGDHRHHACVDLGPCAAPHPSTLAVALLALDAQVHLADGRHLTMEELLGDERDPTRTHSLDKTDLVEAVELPVASSGWRSAYHRTIHRSRAEWPIVEAFVSVRTEGSTIIDARIAMGGVANRPLRLREIEEALVGQDASGGIPVTLSEVTQRATGNNAPLPGTAWKVPLMAVTLVDTLAMAMEQAPSEPLVVIEPPTEEQP